MYLCNNFPFSVNKCRIFWIFLIKDAIFFLSYFLLVIISIITHQFTLFMRQVLCYNTYNYILSEDSSSTWIFDTLKKHQCNQQSVLMCLQILQRFLILNRKLTRLLRQRPEARFRFTAGPLVSDDFIEN